MHVVDNQMRPFSKVKIATMVAKAVQCFYKVGYLDQPFEPYSFKLIINSRTTST